MDKGEVKRVIGPVVDVQFAPEDLPELYNAIEIELPDRKVTLETVQQTGGGIARCIALSATDGISRGMTARNTGAPITMPATPAMNFAMLIATVRRSLAGRSEPLSACMARRALITLSAM